MPRVRCCPYAIISREGRESRCEETDTTWPRERGRVEFPRASVDVRIKSARRSSSSSGGERSRDILVIYADLRRTSPPPNNASMARCKKPRQNPYIRSPLSTFLMRRRCNGKRIHVRWILLGGTRRGMPRRTSVTRSIEGKEMQRARPYRRTRARLSVCRALVRP